MSHFRTRKTAELLAYLAYYRHRSHPREVLCEMLWPECDPDAGRHSLSTALSSLRQQLEPPGIADGAVLTTDRHSVGLNPAAVLTDVAEFEAVLRSASKAVGWVERAQALTRAVELYTGELLPGYYEDWVGPEQQRLDELYFHAVRQLIGDLERTGEIELALQHALRAVSVNRLREEAHREVIRLYAGAGRRDGALRQYRALECVLREELETTPARETRALMEAIEQGAMGTNRWPAPPPLPAVPVRPEPLNEAFRPAAGSNLEPVGGAVPLDSRLYVARSTDAAFKASISRGDSVVLVKGARQVGKTSLLARGLHQARQAGARVVLTHFQMFNTAHLESADAFLLALAETAEEQLGLDLKAAEAWDPRRGPNPNFRRYLRRQVFSEDETPLVWGMDEVDRLFSCPFGSEIFGLFRSWHDERALEPEGPWANLTLAMAYSTEAHLFITDINQSPFNVGTRLTLEDFTLDQVADLNRRHGSPLDDPAALNRFHSLLDGHPYLVRSGLHEMAAHSTRLEVLEARAASDDWIFGEHLRRIGVLLDRNAELQEAVRVVLQGGPCPTREGFYRLRSAGVLTGESPREARPRCRLYAAYLEQLLL